MVAPSQLATNTASVIIAVLLHAKPGSLTTKEAHALLDQLTHHPDFEKTIHTLLVSTNVSDRLLAVYALLERNGLTPEMRQCAIHDPSPYVRAEIASWLFRRLRFDDLDAIVKETVTHLAPKEMEAVVNLASTEIHADVPMPLSRLKLGEGLPNYLTLLAKESPALTATCGESLGSLATPASGKKLMMTVLATVRPPEYVKLLERRLDAEPSLNTRTLIAQHLAASVSESNVQMRTKIETSIQAGVAGIEPVAYQWAEQQWAHKREIEVAISAMATLTNPNWPRLKALSLDYLKAGRMLGPTALDSNTLHALFSSASKTPEAPFDDDLAMLGFIDHQKQMHADVHPSSPRKGRSQ